MMNNHHHLTRKFSLIAIFAFSFNIYAKEHGENHKDFIYSPQDLKSFSEASLTTISDDQFVFNNELSLLDWDSIFASYFPHLKPHQETIMHYAGYYSINPKLLISMIESQSKLVTSPSEKAYLFPFGNLSKNKGFKSQIKDVSSQLSKRFYAYKKLTLNVDKNNFVLRNNVTSNSAATIAIASMLTSNNKTELLPVKNKYAHLKNHNSPLEESGSKQNEININHILNAYENIFAQTSDELISNNNEQVKKSVTRKRASNTNALTKAAAVNVPSLYLPWTSGWSWKTSGGAHGFDGSTWPLSSLDFYYPGGNSGWGGNKPAVYASHGGTVTWYSRCNMRITHASGIATNYYHMDNLQYGSGTYINAGTYIGTYANTKSASLCEGGTSTGPHLHISLLKNGYYESLQGYNFSGFYVDVGNSQYDTNCSTSYLWKNGTTYCHGSNIYKPYE